MPLKFKRSLFPFSTSKIAFLLIIGVVSILSIQLLSCSSKKEKKKKESIEYSLKQYPLTSYYLTVNKDSLDFIYQNPKDNNYIYASLKIEDQEFDSVMLRIRGDSSRDLPKKSLKIKLAKGSKLKDGAKKINLNGDYVDRTMMHQYLASKTMNDNGQLCFRSGYAPLYINGEYFGLYLRVENMDNAFLKSRNLSTKNNLYKATKDYSCLIYRSEVDHKWEKKTNKKEESREDLKQLIEELNEVSTEDFENYAKEHFFYDEMVNIIALNMLIVNASTYYHNYYMYHDLKKDKWRMLPWDMDKTFNPDHIDYNYQKTSWAEGASSGIHSNTLIEKFLANKNTLQSIRDRIVELKKNFTGEKYSREVEVLKKEIQNYIFMDKTNKISSKNTWNKNLNNLVYFVKNRPDALLNQIDNKPLTFMVRREVDLDDNSAVITWDEAIDPNGLSLSYTFYCALNGDFKSDNYIKLEGLNTTTVTLENLVSGKYFFFVSTSNSEFITYGHDIRNSFVIP